MQSFVTVKLVICASHKVMLGICMLWDEHSFVHLQVMVAMGQQHLTLSDQDNALLVIIL